MTVNKVQPYVCYGNKYIKTLNCDYVGEIEDYAFYGCSNMTSLTLGEQLTSIGKHSFENCSSLQSVIVPDSVTQFGSYSFSGCSSLPSIKIPEAVKTIGDYTFFGCTGLKTFAIAERDDKLTLGNNGSSPLFGSCPLDSVYIGGDITYQTSSNYGYSPFYRNKTLRTVVITDKETEISPNEFYGCTNLQNFSVGDGVMTFGDWAFSSCSSLKSLSFGTQLQTIGKEAFSDCVAVTKIVSKTAMPPVCGSQALDDISKWTCTLIVPTGSLSAYQAADQWKEFFFVEEGDGGNSDTPSTKKCAMPIIHYADGKLNFDCATEAAHCIWTIKSNDVGSGEGNSISLFNQFLLTVYATATGYEDSDCATATLVWGHGDAKGENVIRIDGEGSAGSCDVNQDGVVDVADIATIISTMAGK